MAIKNLDLQLNEAGKIKIGIKGKTITSAKGNEFRPPQKLDHFILTTTERDSNGDYIVDEALQDLIKENQLYVNNKGDLVKLPIRLLYDDTELNFPTRYVSYVSGQMSCFGDGEQSFKRVNDFAKPTACPCPRIEQGYTGDDKCKPTGTLTVILDEAGYFGTAHKFRTTSMNTVKGILGGIELIKTATKGKISGLPLLLTLTEKNTVTPSGHKTTIYVVSIVYRGTMADLRGEVLQLMNEEKQYQLTMKDIEEEALEKADTWIGIEPGSEDEQDFMQEFFPGAVVVQAKDTDDIVKDTLVVDTVVEVEAGPGPELEPEKQEEGNAVSTTAPAPVGPYAELYERFLEESDFEAALKLANRLKKPDLIYFMETECSDWELDKSQLKPGILETIAEALKVRLGFKEGTTDLEKPPVKAVSNPDGPEHPFIAQLLSMDSHIDVANAVSEYCKPIPIDRTRDIPALIEFMRERIAKEPVKYCSECKAVQFRTLSGISCPNGHGGADSVYVDPTAPGAAETVKTAEKEAVEPEPKTVADKTDKVEEQPVEEKKVYPREADDSGPITKDQLRRLVYLKGALEKIGKLSPDKWGDHVGYFLDTAGDPLKTAKGLTTVQGANFIEMLEEHVPF